MAVTLDNIISLVRDEANRGNTADNVIPAKIIQAIGFIERNHTLKYMEQLEAFDIFEDITQEAPYTVFDNLKEVKYIRTVNFALDGTGEYTYLKQRYSGDGFPGILAGAPTEYEIIGNRTIWFNSVPTETCDAHIFYIKYTGFLNLSDTCWLFDHAQDAVIAKTMQLLAPFLRQPALIGAYQPMMQEGIKTLIKANEDEKLNAPVTYGELTNAR